MITGNGLTIKNTSQYKASIRVYGDNISSTDTCYANLGNLKKFGVYTTGVNTHNLPSEYQEVEQIQSSGTQLINTEFAPLNSPYLQLKFKLRLTGVKASNYFYGAGSNSSDSWASFEYCNTSGSSYQGKSYWNMGSSTLKGAHAMSLDKDYEYNCKYNNGTFTVSGATSTSLSYSGNLGIGSLAIFGSYYNDAVSNSYMRLYSFQIYSGANFDIVRNFIPCYRKSDNAVGLYDLCNSTCSLTNSPFYTDVHEGSFTIPEFYFTIDNIYNFGNWQVNCTNLASKHINIDSVGTYSISLINLPSEYQEVEWIESPTSSVSIPLNYYSISSTMIRFKYIYTHYGGSSFIGTVRDGEGNQCRYFRANSTTYWDFGSGSQYNRISGSYVTSTTAIYETEIGNRYVKDLTTNTTKFSSSTVSFSRKSYSMNLFAPADYGRVYYVKIYEDENLIKNFVPCYRKSDGVVGLYDLCGTINPLTNVPFYINSSSGELTKGDDIL